MNKKIREAVHQKCGGRCGYCGTSIAYKEMQIDHIIPQRNWELYVGNKFKVPPFLAHLTISDLHHFDNLMPSCRSCNNYKNTYDLEGFRYELNRQIEQCNKYSINYRMAKRFGQVQETPSPIKFHFER